MSDSFSSKPTFTGFEVAVVSVPLAIITFFLGVGSSPFRLDSYVEVITSAVWPVSLLLLVAYFRQPLLSILNNVAERVPDAERMDLAGASVRFSQRNGEKADKKDLEDFKKVEMALPMGRGSNAILHLEKILLESAENTAGDLEHKFKLVVRELAIARLQVYSFITCRGVFRSQVELLKEIGDSSHKYPKDVAARHYEVGKERSPEWYSGYSLDDWLAYMERRELIIVDNNEININYAGEFFLQFIAEEQMNSNQWIG